MAQEDNPQWQYKADDPGSTSAAKPRGRAAVSWEASEFIEHDHGIGWYALLVLVTAALTAAVYLISKDYFATGVMVVIGIIVGIFANQKPSQAKYEITSSGLKINDKNYIYSDYKSFAVIREGALSSINLFPLKRFRPPISAYFPQEEEEKIVETLGNYLPYDPRGLDGIDRLTRRLRL